MLMESKNGKTRKFADGVKFYSVHFDIWAIKENTEIDLDIVPKVMYTSTQFNIIL
jgi:hypothetical protein